MIDTSRLPVVTLALGLAITLTACAGSERSSEGDSAAESDGAEAASPAMRECVLGQGTVAADDSTADWAGDYSVVLLSTDGNRADGTLTLGDQAEALTTLIGVGGEVAPNTRIPLYGWIDIDVAAVGAVVPGDALSRDPEAPGVAVLESRMGDQAPNILLRLGSEANQRGLVRYDGAFTVLRVTEISVDGFRGRWNSGVGTDRAEGAFCAFAN